MAEREHITLNELVTQKWIDLDHELDEMAEMYQEHHSDFQVFKHDNKETLSEHYRRIDVLEKQSICSWVVVLWLTLVVVCSFF